MFTSSIFSATGRLCIATALLAAAAVRANEPRDYKAESQQVYRLCRNLSAPVRLELASLHFLLTPDEFNDLLLLRNERSCERWIEEYWRIHDPIFTTPENEARAEHERRVEFATAWFGRAEWPGWDQRGEVCVRYGLPAGRDSESPDVVPPGTYVRAIEYWFYPALGMTVQFEDAMGNGNYTYFLEHVALPSWERPENDRRTLASKYLPDLDMESMTLDAPIGGGILNPSWEFSHENYQQSLWRFYEVLETNPVVYPFNFEGARVPFVFDVAYFRGGESVDRVDVNAEFVVAPAIGGATEYHTTVAVFDMERGEVARLSHTTHAVAPSSKDELVRTMVLQLPFTLEPSRYDLAITVEEVGAGRFSSYLRTITPDNFEERLAVSTVCFSSGIAPVTRESAFNRGALEVIPKPSARYPIATSVPVYFEIYNLTGDNEGLHRYTVSYRVIPQTPAPRGLWKKITGGSDDGAALASSFQSAANGPHDVVYVFLKTDELWPGEYEFDVSIVDEVSRSQTRRTGRFHLVE